MNNTNDCAPEAPSLKKLSRAGVIHILDDGSDDLCNKDLSNIDLRGLNLSGEHLSASDASGANLSGAKLVGATLSGTIFKSADLSGVSFYMAHLSKTDFRNANLRGADLRVWGNNMQQSDLRGADLREADLSGVNLGTALIDENTIFDSTTFFTWAIVPKKYIGYLEAAGVDLTQLDDEVEGTGEEIHAAVVEGGALSR